MSPRRRKFALSRRSNFSKGFERSILSCNSSTFYPFHFDLQIYLGHIQRVFCYQIDLINSPLAQPSRMAVAEDGAPMDAQAPLDFKLELADKVRVSVFRCFHQNQFRWLITCHFADY